MEMDGDCTGELSGHIGVQVGRDTSAGRDVRQFAGWPLGWAAGVHEPTHEVNQIAVAGLAPHLCV
jgi:hypothetical protein